MTTQQLVERVDQLIQMGNDVWSTRRSSEYSRDYVDSGLMKGFRSVSLSFIQQVYGDKHPHFAEFAADTEYCYTDDIERGLGILKAIRSEIEGGWLFTVKGLITAEVFADFIEMAEHLLESGYKDPAAVMAGSVLEEHLRQLCNKNGIAVTRTKNEKDVPLKADMLNSELAKADVYTKLDQKQVTAWLGLRNKAAHGEYDEYNEDQVRNMISGVVEFMARVAV